MNKFCIKCGNKLSKNDKICSKCSCKIFEKEINYEEEIKLQNITKHKEKKYIALVIGLFAIAIFFSIYKEYLP